MIHQKIEELLEARFKKELGQELGGIDWDPSGKFGYVKCPGASEHSTPTVRKHTRIFADDNPQFDCRHDSCRAIREEWSRDLKGALQAEGVWEPGKITTEQREKFQEKTAHEKLSRWWAQKLQCMLEEYEWPVEKIRGDSAPITDPYQQFLEAWPSDANMWFGEPWHSGKLLYSKNIKTPAEWAKAEKPVHPFTCGSSFKQGAFARSLETLESRHFTIVECDSLDQDATTNMNLSGSILRFIRETLGWNLKFIVTSGNKSLHGWFEYPGDAEFEKACVSFEGLGVDLKTLRPTQPVRSPNFVRDNGNLQEMIWIQ